MRNIYDTNIYLIRIHTISLLIESTIEQFMHKLSLVVTNTFHIHFEENYLIPENQAANKNFGVIFKMNIDLPKINYYCAGFSKIVLL